MQRSVNLSEQLISQAAQSAKRSERSVAAQIEHWAQLGKYLEQLIPVDVSDQTPPHESLSDLINRVNLEKGQQQLSDLLRSRPFPHFESVPNQPDLIRKIESDGTITVGHFVNRRFKANEDSL